MGTQSGATSVTGLALLALCSGLLSGAVSAADHRDSPLVVNDPAADLNDIYLFVNPRNAAETIVISTVAPFANVLSRFSDAVDYRIHIDNGVDSHVITCRFPGSTSVRCDGITGLSASGSIGKINNGTGGFRVYTGLRDDPFFFDLAAFNATRNALAPRFVNPGVNAFNGNTLAIVMGIPSAALNGNGARNTLKVYGSTQRTGGAGISPAISGSWYDNQNPGHGLNLEVVTGTQGDRLNVSWLAYDNGGRQLYLVGTGPISGTTATVPVAVTSGGRFPPPFTASQVTVRPVGQLTFSFSGCNNGSVTYALTDPNLPMSGTVPLNRLTSISGLSCSFLSSGQIDRNGRPAINTALINLVPSTGTALKDAYNRATSIESWNQFLGEMQANLAALDTLDGAANALLPAATLANVLVDDRLIIDVSKPNCDEYLAVELGVANKCGGRTLARDVIDDTLGAVVGPGVKDNVANDSTFLTDFPFMGEPN
jgi:Domain of unknown function (DUF4331)